MLTVAIAVVATVAFASLFAGRGKEARYDQQLMSLGFHRSANGFHKVSEWLRIEVHRAQEGKQAVRLHVRIWRTDGDMPPLRLVRQGMLDRVLGYDDLEVGDPALDRLARIEGDVGDLCMRFDSAAREGICEILGTRDRELSIEQGIFSSSCTFRGEFSYVDLCHEVAKRVLRVPHPGDVIARYDEEAAPGVRERLVRTGLKWNESKDAIAKRAIVDKDMNVRAIAAMYLRNAPALSRILASQTVRPTMAIACVQMIREMKAAEGIHALRAVLLNPQLSIAHVEALQALLAFADADCETEVLAAFDGGVDEVKRAAITWISRHGSAVTMGRLQKLKDAWLADGRLREQAAHALALVRSRAGDVDGGEISLDATQDQGAVSVVKDDRED